MKHQKILAISTQWIISAISISLSNLTWAASFPIPPGQSSVDILGKSCHKTHCTAVGEAFKSGSKKRYPVAYISEDHGQHWTLSPPLALPHSRPHGVLNQVSCSEKACTAVGQTFNDNGHSTPLAYVSDDNGRSWNMSNSFPLPDNHDQAALFDISCRGAECIAVGQSFHKVSTQSYPLIYISGDGGHTWLLSSVFNPPERSQTSLVRVRCLDATCYATGSAFNKNAKHFNIVYLSKDRGHHWQLSEPTPPPATIIHPPTKKSVPEAEVACKSCDVNYGHWYVGGDLGASFSSPKTRNPTIHYYDGGLKDEYPLSSNWYSATLFGFNLGYEFLGGCRWPAIAIGIGTYGASSYNYKGRVIETALGDPSSTLYRYQFYTSTWRVMAEAKATWSFYYVNPFIDIGAGVAWNNAYQYRETPVDASGYVPLPSFAQQTNHSIAGQVGLGISYAFNLSNCGQPHPHEKVSIGYHYTYLGKLQFGTRGELYPFSLKYGNLATQEIYFNYTHLF